MQETFALSLAVQSRSMNIEQLMQDALTCPQLMRGQSECSDVPHNSQFSPNTIQTESQLISFDFLDLYIRLRFAPYVYFDFDFVFRIRVSNRTQYESLSFIRQ